MGGGDVFPYIRRLGLDLTTSARCGVFPYIRLPSFRSNNLCEVILGLSEGPWHGLDGPSGLYVGPHRCSSTRIVTK